MSMYVENEKHFFKFFLEILKYFLCIGDLCTGGESLSIGSVDVI